MFSMSIKFSLKFKWYLKILWWWFFCPKLVVLPPQDSYLQLLPIKCFLCDFSFEIKKNIKNLLQLRCFDCAHPKAGQNTQQTLPRFPLKTTKYPKVLGSPMKRLLNERILSCVQFIISNLKMQNDYVLFLDLYCLMPTTTATSNCKLFFSSKLVQL